MYEVIIIFLGVELSMEIKYSLFPEISYRIVKFFYTRMQRSPVQEDFIALSSWNFSPGSEIGFRRKLRVTQGVLDQKQKIAQVRSMNSTYGGVVRC